MTRIVIVGGGIAGLRTAEALRDNGFRGELVGVGAEAHQPYSRPPLSKSALHDSDGRDIPLPSSVDMRWRLGIAATSLDLAGGHVELADGRRVGFDAAVLATGLRARQLPGAARTMTLRTIEDAARLRTVLHGQPGHLVIVGGGFIGSEVAGAAQAHDWSVTVVDASIAPLSAALGRSPARWLWEQHRVRGVRTRFGESVAGTESVGDRQHVLLNGGVVLIADAVVTGLGAVPNTEWLAGAGLDLTDGVLTNAARHVVTADGTVIDNVVAVGDLARGPSPLAGGRAVRFEHWAAATTDAHQAAAALTGREPPPEPAPVFWTDVYCHRVQVVGLPRGHESEPEPGPRGFCVRFHDERGSLSGGVTVNWPQRLPALHQEINKAGAAA